MSKYKVLLLDVDGVLVKQHKLFSHAYAEEYGYDKGDFDKFFAVHHEEALRGKKNYDDLIIEHKDVWRWDKEPKELMGKWYSFGFEENLDLELIKLVEKKRSRNLKVYLATNQETGRAKFLEDRFSDFLDGVFSSSQIGAVKEEPEFFKYVIKQLREEIKGIKPNHVLFFDDDPLNIQAAIAQGIVAHIYKSARQVEKYLTS
jgi:HAD superfamily hydrolase (TIGR01549 family)